MAKAIVHGSGLPPLISLGGGLPEIGFRNPKPAMPRPRWVGITKPKKKDRRSRNRLLVHDGAFAMLCFEPLGLDRINEMSMGDIACAVFKSNPVKMGQIRDISLDGLAFSYVDNCADSEKACRLDILVAHGGFYLHGLTFRMVSDREIPEDTGFQVVKTKIAGLQFKDLEPDQVNQLKRFLRRHTLP